MSVYFRNRAGPLAAILATMFMSLTAAQASLRRIDLPEGTVIPVRLDQALSSKTAHVGDRVIATVRSGNDDAGLPEGTRVGGVVTEVIRAANGKPGLLDMDFRRIVLPNGQTVTLNGSMISLDSKSVKRSDSGQLVASGDKGKDRLKWVGIGAGAGLLLGVLTKGNTVVDTLLGAGAGYLYNEFGNKPKAGDVNLKAGVEFGVRLDRHLALNTNQTEDVVSSGVSSDDSSYYNDSNNQYRNHSTNHINMTIDNRDVYFGSAKPYMRGNQSMVPLAAVSRAARFDYRYNARQKTISARNGTLRLKLGSRIAMLHGIKHRLPVSAEMHNGTLYVPPMFVGLATGRTTEWDADNRTIVMMMDDTH